MKHLGKDGIIIKLYKKIDKIVCLYEEALSPEGGANCDILEFRHGNQDEMEEIYVRFRADYDTSGFSITEAMFENPEKEINKLLELANKEKQREKWREAKERQRNKNAEFLQYKRLKKKYEND